MKINKLELTRSEYLYAIKYGEVDNSKYAAELFKRIKKTYNLNIAVCECSHYAELLPDSKPQQPNLIKILYLHCYIHNYTDQTLSELVTADIQNGIFRLFDELLSENDIELQFPIKCTDEMKKLYDGLLLPFDDAKTERRLVITDFSKEARLNLIERSCSVIERFLYAKFNAEAVVFSSQDEKDIPTHIIAVKNKDDLKNISSEENLALLHDRFKEYLEKQDFWKVFEGVKYTPKLCLTSELNQDQRFRLARDYNNFF